MNARILIPAAALLLFAVAPAGAEDAATEPAPVAAEPAPVTKEAASDALELGRLAVCVGVEERKPVGEAASFPSDVGKLWCFTKVLNAQEPTQIFHRWYVGDRLVNEIPINVKGISWRCWSAKTIQPGWSGDCRVEILTEEGDVIGTQEFQLSSPGEASASSSEG